MSYGWVNGVCARGHDVTQEDAVRIANGKRVCRACGRLRKKGPVPRLTPVERFWSKVDKTGECWLWTGGTDKGDYGTFALPGGVSVRCHRFSWELERGPIPTGLLVCHTCDTPRCVNPTHLFLGTPKDNTADMMTKGRSRFGRRLTEDNVREIRRLVATGATRREVAERFGVSASAVGAIVARYRWSHVS